MRSEDPRRRGCSICSLLLDANEARLWLCLFAHLLHQRRAPNQPIMPPPAESNGRCAHANGAMLLAPPSPCSPRLVRLALFASLAQLHIVKPDDEPCRARTALPTTQSNHSLPAKDEAFLAISLLHSQRFAQTSALARARAHSPSPLLAVQSQSRQLAAHRKSAGASTKSEHLQLCSTSSHVQRSLCLPSSSSPHTIHQKRREGPRSATMRAACHDRGRWSPSMLSLECKQATRFNAT